VAKVWPQEDPATGPPAKPPADTHQPAAAAAAAAAAAGSSSAPWLLLGNARWLASAGVTLSPAQLADAERVEAAGESPVHVALAWRRSGSPPPASPGESRSGERVDASGGPRLAGTPAESFDPQTLAAGEWLGCLGVTDTVRGQAGEVLRRLREDGVGEIVLLTGDRPGAARELTGQLAGLDAWHAGLLPQDKAAWVTQRQGAGRRVVMVGDGINDAPALKSASVGIAVAQAGANLAGEAGDVLLLGDPLTALPGLLRLSRALVQNIRRSITWFGFGFNALGVLLSAWGWLSPVASAVVHEVGSLAVMLHALQLLWFERGPSPTGSRVGASLAATGVWVGNWLSPSRWIYRLLRHRRKLLPLAGCLLAGWWLTRNLVLLNPDEQALVQRLGRYHETIGPGLWWRWPPPFESLRRERPERLQSLAFGFRTAPRPVTTPGDYRAPVEWQTTHEDQGYLMLPDEALLLTGDELLVELTAEAQWQITDLREYARQSSDPAAILRGLVESALREVVARKPLEDLLGANRSDWEQDCLQAAQAALARHQLGLRLVNLNLLEVHPPGGVVPSYRDVANALEEREQLLNLGQTQAARTLLATGGEPALAAFPLAPRTSRDTLPPLPGPRPATSAEAPPSSPESIPPPPGGAPLPAQPAHQSGPVAAAGLTEALWRELAADPAGDLESRDPGVGETGDVPPKGRGVSPPAEGEPGRVTPPGPASGPGATAGLDRSRLAGRAAETLHRARADRAVRQFSARGQADRFRAVQQPHAASPQLTLLHLYWESLEQTLANRPLLIVDPQAEGRRQIWLNESGLSPADLPAPPTSSPANPGDSSVPAFPRRPVLPPDDDTQ